MLLAAGVFGSSLSRTGKTGIELLLGERASQQPLTFTAARSDLSIKILASGMLESANAVDVLSEVEGQVGIVSLLERGTQVRKDEVVVELDSSLLQKSRMEQRVLVEQARAATAQANEALQLAKSQAESDIRAAQLALRFADLDLKKYIEGDYPQMVRQVDGEITLATEEQKRADERIKHSKGLKELGYISEGQVDADGLMVLRAKVALELARQKKQLLEQFTHVRNKEEYESKVDEARRQLERSQNRARAIIEQAETKLAAQRSTEELETSRLAHLEDQIAKCKLVAPQDGAVLYPLPQDEDEPPPIKHGAIVHQRQLVFTIPSTDKLRVRASIHEAVVHQIKPGQLAKISTDALPGRVLEGTTQSVSTLPDLQNWRKSTVNFYPAMVMIDQGDTVGIRPSMNAKVEIDVKTLTGVISIPIPSVVRSGEKSYCCVLANGQTEIRSIKIGKSNDEFVEVTAGLSEGEQIVMSPEAARVAVPPDDDEDEE
jgi:HlyD family secretion protein